MTQSPPIDALQKPGPQSAVDLYSRTNQLPSQFFIFARNGIVLHQVFPLCSLWFKI